MLQLTSCRLRNWHRPPCVDPLDGVLLSQVQKTPMDFDTFDTDIFAEINDMPGEIFDIPEMQDEKKFDLEGYINGNIDY